MKALVKYALADGAVEIRDVPAPELQRGTVLVAARAVGVCGSDVHMWRDGQSWEVKLPLVLGHETAGVIAAVADDVTGWKVGDRVVCETAASICGVCALCRTGRYNLCPERQGYGAIRDGAFGELLLAEPRVLHRIPDNVSFEQAAMTEPFAVAYTGVVERADIKPGDLVVVQGAGTIGQLAAQMARLRGAGTVIMLGTSIDEARLAKAREMGVDRTIDITTEDANAVIAQLGDGLGAHVVIEATGVSIALKQSLEIVRPYGTIVKIGWGPQPLNFSLDPLVAKAVTLAGSFSHTWTTWEAVLSMFSTGTLQTDKVLGGVYPLEEWEEAFEAMESGRNVKSVMLFS
ncbi:MULTISPECIES: zinc-binding dehydrogenase [unclassified Salinibacterium]|uniref:zinc-dependent alcohol dehydrogenase n=1 Tax=unclassified Salinibacterium TaxID=2632331 RepID=UPI001423996F|nr:MULTISPECIES: zinc-binding dehydrogenase [unclassified Salinibacterium]